MTTYRQNPMSGGRCIHCNAMYADHEKDTGRSCPPRTRRDLCAPDTDHDTRYLHFLHAPGPQGLSHRPLPDLTQPTEQDRALAYLISLQDCDGTDRIEPARLLAAIHNTLYELWTAPAGTPNARPTKNKPTLFTCRNCGAVWNETRERDQKHRGKCPSC